MSLILVSVVFCVMMLPSGDCQNSQTARINDYGESVMITCTERSDVTFEYWLLPDVQTRVDLMYTGRRVQLLGNYSLYIESAEKEDMGDYLCRVLYGTEPLYYKTTLYLYVPTLWEVYRQNVIVGCSAAGIALVFFITICAIDHCRYSNRQQRLLAKKEQLEMTNTGTSQGIVNNGYETVTVPGKFLAPDGSLVINTEQYTQ